MSNAEPDDEQVFWKLNQEHPFVQAFGKALKNPNLRPVEMSDLRVFTEPELMVLMVLRMSDEPMSDEQVSSFGGYKLSVTRRALAQLERTGWASQAEGWWAPL